ncbi:MAG: GGDEF domain-containing protein [Lysobacterales bacterium]
MDPTTAFIIAALMMLLNGAVLGLLHGDLPRTLRPAATLWRIGTVLIALGCVALALQRWLPIDLLLPLANGLVVTGTVCYHQALRRFDGRPIAHWPWWLPLACALLVWWYSAPSPDLRGRAIAVSAALGVVMVLTARDLFNAPAGQHGTSRRLLASIFTLMATFFLLRSVIVGLAGTADASILDATDWLNIATPMVSAVMPVIGTTCFLLLCSDRLRRDWELAASTDQLTGLANRRNLQRLGAERIAAATSGERPFSLAVLDIDHFKQVNDSHGHQCGDLALRHVAETLREAAGSAATVCRHGGEEFVVLLDVGDPRTALADGERLRAAVAGRPFMPPTGSEAIRITVSIGVTCWQPGDAQLDELLRRADRALYRAKAEARDRVIAG